MADEIHAIGIDLGTKYSCVAVWSDDHAEIIANDMGNRTTRACVTFTDTKMLVGDEAFNQVGRNPANAIFDATRLIGRKFSDKYVQEEIKYLPFKVIEGPADKPMIVVTQKGEEKQFSAEEISSVVLRKMRQIAEEYLCSYVKNAVIAVPRYFNNSQRQATKDAAEIAGLNVLQIINAPAAAAMAYGIDNKSSFLEKRNVMIFDWGATTLDVSLLTGQNHNVLASSGDTRLGGEDLDNRLVRYCLDKFQRENNVDISAINPKALRRLKIECEKAKEALSFTFETDIEIDCLFGSADFYATLTRPKFEELNRDIFRKCMEHVKMCLKNAKMDISNVEDVILVGGSSKNPMVQELLKEVFEGKELCKGIIPDEAVAYGAAALAALVSGNVKGKSLDFIALGVVPMSLGTEFGEDDLMSVMIPRNTTIPANKHLTFVTIQNNQRSVHCGVFEGERKLTKDNNFLGGFIIEGIPPAPKGAVEIDVCFSIDANGLLTVSAVDKTTGQKKEISIDSNKRNGPLTVSAQDKSTGQKKDISRRTRLQEERDYYRQQRQREDEIWNLFG